MSKEIKKSEESSLSKKGKDQFNLMDLNSSSLTFALDDLVLPRLFYQLVVFILDGTGSMTWKGKTGKPKGVEIDETISKILERLDNSKNKNSFDIAVYAFAETHKTILEPTQLDKINYKSFDFNPTNYFKDGYMFEKLDDTLDVVKEKSFDYLEKNKEKNSQALLIILSDGAIKHFDTALERVNKIKTNKRITVSSVLLEDMRWDNDEKFKEEVQNKLKLFSSSQQDGHNFFTSNIDPEEIRKHMIKSISTVSRTQGGSTSSLESIG